MQGARPRVIIAHLQIGLAVQLHHHYASRSLIDTLSRHGVCSTYDEVLKFNENAALEQGTDIPSFEGQFVQYVADNVDHNVRTLDGRDTFHGMGMVAVVTPATTQANRVPRRNVTQEEVAKAGKVEIKPPSDGRLEELNIVYNDVLSITVQDPTANLDVLWKTSLLLSAERPALPICAETNRVMQSLSGVDFNSGEQNKDICKARMQRDLKDTVTVLTSLAERSPFAEDPSLRNIMTGVNADSNVNVDAAAEVGTKVLESMTGKSVCSYSFSRCAQAITMASKSLLTIGNESVQVDPQLLFQRLILACNSAEELTSVFQYELASYPTALFESPLMMNPAQKPGLADAIWSTLSPDAKTGPTTQVHYVLDGGALLHRVPWPRGNGTYRDVLAAYTSYVSRKYGRPTVVFDGYDDISTKYSTQKRQTRSDDQFYGGYASHFKERGILIERQEQAAFYQPAQ